VTAPSPVATDLLVPTGGRVFAEFDIEPADLTYLQTFQETLTPEIQEWIVAQWQAEVAALPWFEDLHLAPEAVAALFATLASFLRRLLAGDRIPELYDELEQVTLVALRHGVRSTDIFQASTKLESVLTGVILQLFSGSDQQTVALVTVAKFLKSLLYVVMETYRREAADELERRNRELQDRTEQLAHSVAELQALEEVLRAVNSSLDLDTVLATIISRAVQLSQADEGTIYEFNAAEEVFVPKAAFGMNARRVEALRRRRIKLGETHLGRSVLLRAPVYVADVQQDPSVRTLPGIHAVLAVPLLRDDKVVGGLVIRRRTEAGFAPTIPTLLQTFAGQAVLAIENAQLFQELAARGEEARRARITAEATLADLRGAQDRLVQAEKMASLGQLTAGIAHEIKNPLNFVNNFASLSVELLDELKETAAPAIAALGADKRAEVDETMELLTGNLEKIAEHGKRADNIVKSMLEHSRGASGERRDVDLNGVIEEALNLAYHGARAQDQSFNITLERDYATTLKPIELAPQEMTRVFLNLFGNGLYAATKRARENGDRSFRPVLAVATREAGDAVEVRVRDNGTGIPPEIKDKLFQPFFTTKPTGEGTGLGLSISYDIVTQQHGGTITVESEPGAFTEFTIRLPRQ
jgi:signal transduction histidine kinase